MCDYSLHALASRPAKVGEKLRTTQFSRSVTRGLASATEPEVAVCLLPGTEVSFDREVRYTHPLAWFRNRTVKEKVARFRQVDVHNPNRHHDAFEFPSGAVVLVTRLAENQTLTVLQLPSTGRMRDEKEAAPSKPASMIIDI
ncbi:MAG TPA: hypothetical protein VH678_05940 [Xanthobacteraceae bacterium]|jgi:hypothetical protein